MKVLVTGSNGQLGRALAPLLPQAVLATRQQLDISDPESVAGFDWTGIEGIINAAAFTKVDAAETGPGLYQAWATNVTAVAQLATQARKLDVPLVHVSSDYVFDGTATAPMDETTPVNPLGSYGLGKAAGELAARIAPKHYVVRTSWLFGDGPNFARTLLSLGRSRTEVGVVDDQWGRPTYAPDLAQALVGLLRRQVPSGTYHISGAGEVVTWAGFTRAIFETAGIDCTVRPVSTGEYFAGKADISPRPAYSAFDLGKITGIGLAPRDWRLGLKDFIEAMKEGQS